MAARKWISGAIKRPGAFKAKAARAKMSTQAFAKKERNAPGRLGKQARLAATLGRMNKGRKKTGGRRKK
jgi:hypothetical protein